MKVCLLGVSFDTGNMGVSALAESSIKIILHQWPDAQVTLLGTGTANKSMTLEISGRQVVITSLDMRFGKNVFRRSHFCVLLLNALLLRLLPLRGFKRLLCAMNPRVKALAEADKVFDITGGDSFSDIYGMRRFLIYGFLQKWIVTQFGKDLILLPQTYGPFKGRLSRRLARNVLTHARTVYARDRAGVEYTKELLGVHKQNGKIRFAPDVAFVLDPREPGGMDVGGLGEARTRSSIVVGLNVSGLLFSGGYTRDNMFGLKTDYRELIEGVVDYLMTDKRTLVLLVPHVFTPHAPLEDDPRACREVYERLNEKYPGRAFLAQGTYNHRDIKYIIGMCDFFMGSRMHSCIAAISQSIPAVGIAYSKKFKGVFDSVGLGQYVADAYQCDKDELLSIVKAAFENRKQIRKQLDEVLPGIRADILNMFQLANGA
ncbi:MAG: polysaccharide pyruvyl transferase family protein [Sedimentisphaerales bacterium]